MADRTGVDVVQKLIGRAFLPAVRAQDPDPHIGAVNAWNVLYGITVGSMDWLHKTGFKLKNTYGEDHPLYMRAVEDLSDFGYINADLSIIGKDSHLWPDDWFDLNWCPCPTGQDDYPAWDGWPEEDETLDAYPVYGTSRVMIFEKGLMYKVERSVGSGTLLYNDYFTVSNSLPWQELYSSANTEIRLFRYTGATYSDEQNQWIPSGAVVECPLSFNIDEIRFDFSIGPSATYDLPDDEPRFFMLYWRSPEYSYVSTQTRPTVTANNDVTSSLTVTAGTGARHLFDSNRYDFISYSNNANQYMKNRKTTRFELIDGNPEHYGEDNPVFYRLPALNGSLDAAISPDDEMAGGGFAYIPGVWGYGYSVDMGDENPSDRDTVVPVIICFQAKSGENTSVQIIRGPEVSPEFQEANWKNFSYWPPTPDGYELFAKAIVKQFDSTYDAAYRPKSYILYIEFVPSYGRKAVENADYRVRIAPLMIENPRFSMSLQSSAAEGLRSLFLLTPYTSKQMAGMFDDASYYTDDRTASIIRSYWRMPFSHPATVTENETIETTLGHILTAGSGFAEILEFHHGLRDLIADVFGIQFSVEFSSFNANTTDPDAGLIVTKGTLLKIARPLEIFFPSDGGCLEYATEDKLLYDYTLRMYLYSQTMDRIEKDLYLSASRYWITNENAADRLAAGQIRDPYLWPTKIDQIHQWNLYGRTAYIPDSRGGEVHTITMRPFDPDDPNLKTVEEFEADLRETYANDLNSGDARRIARAEEAILDAMTDQEYLYGGFDTVDERTVSNSFVGMEKMIVGVTFYNNTGVATWEASSRQWGGDHPTVSLFDAQSGDPRTRYGFSVDKIWYYQSFEEALVQSERRDYMESHPEEADVMKQQTNSYGADNENFAIDGTTVLLSTTFSADFTNVSDEIKTIQLKLRAVGSPTGNLVVSLNSTNPITKIPETVLQVSNEISVESLTDEFAWAEFTFTIPAQLSLGTRYAIDLATTDPEGETATFDPNNRVEWAFANTDVHSYGATSTNSILTDNVGVGGNTIYLQDGTNFSTSSFHIQIGTEILSVSTRNGNTLTLASTTATAHNAGDMVYEVTYSPTDSEERWTMDLQESGTYDWQAPPYQNYDGTYILTKRSVPISLVVEVPVGEWAGSDIRVTEATSDSFYIGASGQGYDVDFEDSDMYMYGYASGLDPLAGFNVASTYDFPPMNDLRAHSTNVTDGYVCWTSERLDDPSTLTIYPLATVTGGAITYIPTANDMYVTIICRKWDDSIEAINVFLAAGFSAPFKINDEKFVSIEMLWVDPTAFADAPFYGFDASERFEIRSR